MKTPRLPGRGVQPRERGLRPTRGPRSASHRPPLFEFVNQPVAAAFDDPESAAMRAATYLSSWVKSGNLSAARVEKPKRARGTIV